MSGEPSPIVQVRLTGPVPTVIDPFPIALIGTAPSVIAPEVTVVMLVGEIETLADPKFPPPLPVLGSELPVIRVSAMALDLEPPQPEPVERAIELLLADAQATVDPWWAAGLEEALRSDDGAAAKDAWGRPGVVEP